MYTSYCNFEMILWYSHDTMFDTMPMANTISHLKHLFYIKKCMVVPRGVGQYVVVFNIAVRKYF